jgi:hypothetical protein
VAFVLKFVMLGLVIFGMSLLLIPIFGITFGLISKLL